MNDIGMLVLPVGLILFPLIFVLLMKDRTLTQEAGEMVQIRQRLLLGWTLISLCVWFALSWIVRLVGGGGGYLPIGIAQACFMLIWFFVAMPLLRLKQPNLVGPYERGERRAGQVNSVAVDSGSSVRTASLVNREKQSPIKSWMLAVGGCLVSLPFLFVFARGFAQFPMSNMDASAESIGSAAIANDAISSASKLAQLGQSQRSAWYTSLISLGVMLPMVLALAWISARRSMSESEPMPGAWDEETAMAYATVRNQRAVGLFWGLIGLGCLLGTAQAFIQWFPNSGPTIGIVFGTIGGLVGLLGGAWGAWMSFQRGKINERIGQSQGLRV